MIFPKLMVIALLCGAVSAAVQDEEPRGSNPAADSDGLKIRQLISNLDADTFHERDEAMQAIAAYGTDAVPFLVESFDHPSAELRMRVMFLLGEHGSFEHVAPLLLRAIDRPGGNFARTVLQGRCMQQIDDAGEIPNCERLFKFWGTTREKFRFDSFMAFHQAQTTAQLATVVEPLRHIGEKVKQFDDLVARLSKLSIASDHRHSPGYIVVETLAKGLRTGQADCVTFSTHYVESLERLTSELSQQKTTPNAIRQEVSNRASWSQGATVFLVQLLDPNSQPSKSLAETIPISPTVLQESFFSGLRAADTASYSRGVGRVHIVDLLNETIRAWPTVPKQGVAKELIACVVATAHEGNKPHALVYLEALDACRKLSRRGFDLEKAPAKQLADRLLIAARSAESHRDYFPTYSVYSKFVGLFERGVSVDHEAFPREYFDLFVRGDAATTSEEQRRLLEKYLVIIDRFMKAGVELQQPTSRPMIRALRKHLANGSDRLSHLAQQLAETPSARTDQLVQLLKDELD